MKQWNGWNGRNGTNIWKEWIKQGKIRPPDQWPGVAVAPRLFSNNNSVRLSLRCRLPCNRDNGSLAQSSGKPGGDEAALGTDCSTNKAGRHAVVIMDGAGWHTMECADDFPNLSLIKLPPYSPELNPIEQVWSWLRQHVLANRSFKDYDDILDACTSAWKHFIADVERVMSSRD